MSDCRDCLSLEKRLHEVATHCATVEQERDELVRKLERAEAGLRWESDRNALLLESLQDAEDQAGFEGSREQVKINYECQKCKGTGSADSGGVQPWGEQIFIPCDCQCQMRLDDPA